LGTIKEQTKIAGKGGPCLEQGFLHIKIENAKLGKERTAAVGFVDEYEG